MADGDIGTGELSRQIRDVLTRFQDLATRLETQFMRTDTFVFYQRLIDKAIKDLEDAVKDKAAKTSLADLRGELDNKASKADLESLKEKVESLEDDKKWLTRLVLGFIILGVLGAVFAVTQGGAGK